MVVTLRQLKRLNACYSGLRDFEQAFGTRARVTRRNMLLMSHHLGFMVGSLFPEHSERAWRPYASNEESTNTLADLLGLK